MGILGKLPILALGRPGSYKISDGYILENTLSFKVRPLFEFECICAKVKHCCRLKSIPKQGCRVLSITKNKFDMK